MNCSRALLVSIALPVLFSSHAIGVAHESKNTGKPADTVIVLIK
jgi:hypothetical protein